MNVCTACVSMRGLIYRSQGCLVSLTSAVNTVILNLHPAKGSKLRNNYARPRLEGVARTTRRRGVHGMNILLSISVSSVLHPPSREIILWKRNFPPNDLTRALESIKSNESVNFVNYIFILSFFLLPFAREILYFFQSKDWTCLRRPISRRVRRRFVCEYEMRETSSSSSSSSSLEGRTLSRGFRELVRSFLERWEEEEEGGEEGRNGARKGAHTPSALYLSICEAIFSAGNVG